VEVLLEQFDDCGFRSVADCSISIFQAIYDFWDVVAEQETLFLAHLRYI
jgi:hypothetical protein